MRILFLIDSIKRGGKERQLFELIKNISTIHETYLISFSPDIEYCDIYSFVKELIILPRIKIGNLSKILSFWKNITRINPQIIHTWDHLSTLYSIIPKLYKKIPLINGSIRYAFQMKRISKLSFIATLGFWFSDVIVANSRAGLKTHRLLNNKKSIVIYNGFDFNRLHDFGKDTTLDTFGNKHSFRVCMVANFLPSKDHLTLITACNDLINHNPDLFILLIGDGPLRNNIEIAIPDEKKHHYKLLGKINEVESLVEKCDIGILLSNTNGHAEGISNSILEYMAAGLPVIATNAGGTIEIVKDGETGFLVAPFDSEMIKDKIKFLINHEETRMKMGQYGREIIQQNFSIKKMVEQYTQLYLKYSI
jgi:glycosyltransferase involved in cell wall biosynthesis